MIQLFESDLSKLNKIESEPKITIIYPANYKTYSLKPLKDYINKVSKYNEYEIVSEGVNNG